MAKIAVVQLAIGERMAAYRAATEPFWRGIAGRLGAELVVLTERLGEGRKLPAWQKLLLPSHLAGRYELVIYADVDILPHPQTELGGLLEVPAGRMGMCAMPRFLGGKPGRYYRRALGLSEGEVRGVREVLNSGLMVWRTGGSEGIQSLCGELYESGRQHCAEQTVLSWGVQERGLLHLLPGVYNTQFVRAKPFPFNTFAASRLAQGWRWLRPLGAWSDRVGLRRLLDRRCFIHFVGGIFAGALQEGARRLQGLPWTERGENAGCEMVAQPAGGLNR